MFEKINTIDKTQEILTLKEFSQFIKEVSSTVHQISKCIDKINTIQEMLNVAYGYNHNYQFTNHYLTFFKYFADCKKLESLLLKNLEFFNYDSEKFLVSIQSILRSLGFTGSNEIENFNEVISNFNKAVDDYNYLDKEELFKLCLRYYDNLENCSYTKTVRDVQYICFIKTTDNLHFNVIKWELDRWEIVRYTSNISVPNIIENSLYREYAQRKFPEMFI